VLDLVLDGLDERSLLADVVEQVLPQDELPFAEVGDAEQEDVRPRATGETSRLRVQPEDVFPAQRRITLESQMRKEQRVRRAVANDLKPKIA
jgi:hypothetical protein